MFNVCEHARLISVFRYSTVVYFVNQTIFGFMPKRKFIKPLKVAFQFFALQCSVLNFICNIKNKVLNLWS
jgi:hypothetical protein